MVMGGGSWGGGGDGVEEFGGDGVEGFGGDGVEGFGGRRSCEVIFYQHSC